MIRHTVAFKLKHPAGSAAEQEFLEAARRLAAIPTVRNFEALRQTGQKNNFDFGLSMEFSSAADYQSYNQHPDHVHFVQTRWLPEVADFLELDYEPLSGAKL
jgi:hypothetical protein